MATKPTLNAFILTRSPAALLAQLAGAWVLGWFGHLFWLFDLLSHFQVWFLGAGIMISLLAGHLRHRRTLFASVFFCLAVFSTIILLAPPQAQACTGQAYKIISFNVLTSNTRKADVMAYLEKSSPDIVVLYEVDDAWASALRSLKGTYPHHIEYPRADNFGIALYSRIPLENIAVDMVGNWGLPLVHAQLGAGPDAPLLIAFHPLPPVDRAMAASRNETLAYVENRLEQAPDRPAIILGDFNATIWSWPLRDLIRRQKLQSLRPHSWTGTWPAPLSIIGIPIDHILGRGLECGDGSVGPALGSDHHPLVGYFRI